MTAIGYTLSTEENGVQALVDQAVRAERAGFSFATIPGDSHRGIDTERNSQFVWGVLGALSQATEELEFTTSVTCPTTQVHPAVVAREAATAAALLPGRFSLGVGNGESADEHFLGDHWPPIAERQERLEEAIEVIRLLWEGGPKSHRGRFYTVENARIDSLPEEPPPILVAVESERSVELAVRAGDGLIDTGPIAESVEQFRSANGNGNGDGCRKPTYGKLRVCWAKDEAEARHKALESWPDDTSSNGHFLELPLPSYFEEAEPVDGDIGDNVVCGPDPERHLAAIRKYLDAGYDHVFVDQVGPDKDGFFDLYEHEILPELR